MTKSEKKSKNNNFNIDLEEMAKAGLQFGHRVSRRHPKMAPFLLSERNTIHIIDLKKTAQKLKEALKFIQELMAGNKILLFVGTKVQIKNLIKDIAAQCGMPYVAERWLGGTFTNFETISKRIEYFKDLEKKKAEGAFENYTKKEQAKIDQELKDLEEKFGGIKNLQSLPDAIFVVDIKKDEITVREAKKKEVKIIAIVHTNVDPTLADFPIPANDDSIYSVKYILEKVKEVIQKAQQEARSKKSETKEK